MRAQDQTCTCKPLALTPTPTLTLMLTLTPNLNSPQSRSFTNDLALAFRTLNISLLQTIATTRAIWSHLRCGAEHCHEVVLDLDRRWRSQRVALCVSAWGHGGGSGAWVDRQAGERVRAHRDSNEIFMSVRPYAKSNCVTGLATAGYSRQQSLNTLHPLVSPAMQCWALPRGRPRS